MKKLIVCLIAAGLTFAAAAQPKALGLRLGGIADVTYQHYTVGNDFVEADLGFQYIGGENLLAKAVYDFSIYKPKISSKGTWNVYAGPGLSMGCGLAGPATFRMGIVAQAGIEYTFWFPLQLSIDLRPTFGFYTGGGHTGFDLSGMYGFIPALSVRYSF